MKCMLLITPLAGVLAATPTFAHAFLDHAIPAVGGTVTGSPRELQINYTENIVLAFSGVHVAAAGGAPVATAKPTLGEPNELIVKLTRPLKPGTYVVSWHVVSVDTHHTQGTYKFTVAP
ncbi:MAG: copper homeostasis periplasmic binding protein CopC [Methylovirgula sp.]|jgi:copper resistance protein C